MVEFIKQSPETSKISLDRLLIHSSGLIIASCRNDPREFAIKKFKPDREGDNHHYVGISQSACREIAV